MKCPHCSHSEDHVIDSRSVETASLIRRHREPFDRDKLRQGVSLACNKRNPSADQIEKLVTDVELERQEEFVREAPSRTIGQRKGTYASLAECMLKETTCEVFQS